MFGTAKSTADLRTSSFSLSSAAKSDPQPDIAPASRQAFKPTASVLKGFLNPERKRAAKPKRGPQTKPEKPLAARILDGVTVLLSVLALAAAFALTAAAFLGKSWPAWLSHMGVPPQFGLQDLTTSVVFFWVEFFAIVLGFRAFDQFTTEEAQRQANADYDRAQTENFRSLSDRLYDTMDSIQDSQHAFAKNYFAAENAQNDGGVFDSAAANFPLLNKTVVDERSKFLDTLFVDDKMTPNVQAIILRILHILDRMIADTFDECERWEELNSHADASVEDRQRSAEKMLKWTDVDVQGLWRIWENLEDLIPDSDNQAEGAPSAT